MKIKNSISGVKAVGYIYPDEVFAFGIILNEAAAITSAVNFRKLSPVRNGITVDVSSPDEGITFKHSFTARFKDLSLADKVLLNNISNRGCIIQYETFSGEIRILGSLESPLFGVLREITATKTTDFSGYELSLSATCTHPQLRYISPS